MSDNELKTLREHNVQVGDVVRMDGCAPRTVKLRDGEPWLWTESDWFGTVARSSLEYRVLSRANAAPAIDLTANRMAFGLLDDATKAAFEAHVAAGGKVEIYAGEEWYLRRVSTWSKPAIYRAVSKGARGEAVMTGDEFSFSLYDHGADTRRLTLPTLDGALICGTYTGPDGAQVVIAMIDGDSK